MQKQLKCLILGVYYVNQSINQPSKILALPLIIPAILFPQIATAKLVNLTVPIDYAAVDGSAEANKGEPYFFANGLNNMSPEIIANAANIHAITKYLEELPNAVENEFTQLNTTVTTQINQTKTELGNQIDQTETNINNQITQTTSEFNTKISQVQTVLTDKFNTLSQLQSNNSTLLNNIQDNWNTQLNQLNTNTNLLNHRINLLSAELDKKFNRTMASQAALANFRTLGSNLLFSHIYSAL